MLRLFDLLCTLYPPDFRAEFGGEMREVFLALSNSRQSRSRLQLMRLLCAEYLGLMRGALGEHCRRLLERVDSFRSSVPSMLAGTTLAFAMHLLLYWSLVPGKSKGLPRVLEILSSRLFLLCLLVGVASAQQPAKQDAATLELARSIYTRAFTELRQAKTLDDMKKLSDALDSPDWISVDRLGRTILTRRDADQELESVLALPPERRVTAMDIIWAEQESDHMSVLAWMMPSDREAVDAAGDYGPKGATHQIARATLVRDLFRKTPAGWRRVRHDKMLPNSTILAVDGASRIMPPLDERHRVTPLK
jgi:hypothetical protein